MLELVAHYIVELGLIYFIITIFELPLELSAFFVTQKLLLLLAPFIQKSVSVVFIGDFLKLVGVNLDFVGKPP